MKNQNKFNPKEALFRSSKNGNLMTSSKEKARGVLRSEQVKLLISESARYEAMKTKDGVNGLKLADKLLMLKESIKVLEPFKNEFDVLSKSAKEFCLEVFINEKFNRKKNFTNKYVQKGLGVEDDAITLLSLVTKRFFKKNEEHLENEFIKGTPDCFEGKTLQTATKIIDVKSSWDIFTFMNSVKNPLNSLYYWQLQSYMWLTGAQEAELIYCLVDTPETIINDEKRRLSWSMGLIDPDANPDYLEACEEIDRVSLYDDIPRSERIHIIPIKRNDEDIERLKSKVLIGREYLKELNNGSL